MQTNIYRLYPPKRKCGRGHVVYSWGIKSCPWHLISGPIAFNAEFRILYLNYMDSDMRFWILDFLIRLYEDLLLYLMPINEFIL